jgi:hypothetical protein
MGWEGANGWNIDQQSAKPGIFEDDSTRAGRPRAILKREPMSKSESTELN